MTSSKHLFFLLKIFIPTFVINLNEFKSSRCTTVIYQSPSSEIEILDETMKHISSYLHEISDMDKLSKIVQTEEGFEPYSFTQKSREVQEKKQSTKKIICNDNIHYLGQMSYGLYEGLGITYNNDGTKQYEGNFKRGDYNGVGILKWANGIIKYVGQFKSGQFHGRGILFRDDKTKIFLGEFISGSFDGKGILYGENETQIYNGDFKSGIFNGFGKNYLGFGLGYYKGHLKSGKFEGEGVLYFDNNFKKFEGFFKDGEYNGKGLLYYKNGLIQYQGFFKSGKYHGKGKMYLENGVLQYDGNFQNGSCHGLGISYFEDGNVNYEGNFNSCPTTETNEAESWISELVQLIRFYTRKLVIASLSLFTLNVQVSLAFKIICYLRGSVYQGWSLTVLIDRLKRVFT